MEEEYDAPIANNTWELVPRPVGSNVATGKWIIKHKFNSNGTLEWYTFEKPSGLCLGLFV
jgi:hypothetical protein